MRPRPRQSVALRSQRPGRLRGVRHRPTRVRMRRDALRRVRGGGADAAASVMRDPGTCDHGHDRAWPSDPSGPVPPRVRHRPTRVRMRRDALRDTRHDRAWPSDLRIRSAVVGRTRAVAATAEGRAAVASEGRTRQAGVSNDRPAAHDGDHASGGTRSVASGGGARTVPVERWTTTARVRSETTATTERGGCEEIPPTPSWAVILMGFSRAKFG
ncbi:MAG: hypothetical protein KatS3mg076_2002 [Candidatus Binatia bacterium]|nr:MAG: hypothetical protein KatS3mg076_2002 [Candidatus Binatia bacterium]